MAYLNVAYTALMKGRNTDHPWGRKQSPDALTKDEPARIADAVNLLVPTGYTDKQAAAVVEQYINLWRNSSIDPPLSQLDPKNTYEATLITEFTYDEIKLFNPAEILYRIGGKIDFNGYPSLKDVYNNEVYWVDRLAAVVVFVVDSRIKK